MSPAALFGSARLLLFRLGASILLAPSLMLAPGSAAADELVE